MMAFHATLEEKLLKLQKAVQTTQNPQPKIQKVPEHLRNRNLLEKYYSPKLVSIGPIHHGNANLKLGENYKLMWAAQYIQNTRRNPLDLYNKIVDKIDELKGHFAVDVLTLASTRESLEGFGSLHEKLSWMLFVDGCSLLHILEKANLYNPGAMNIKVDQLVLVIMDVLLLENQLPYLVLKLLWKNEDDAQLTLTMREFLKCHHWAPEKRRTWSSRIQHIFKVQNNKQENEQQQHSVGVLIPNVSESELPTHLLDLQHKIILTKSFSKRKALAAGEQNRSIEEAIGMITQRNTQDLRAVGIRLKSSGTFMPSDIDFTEGWFTAKLTLPEIVVDETTASTFLNLIAYEMCPDFENDYEICSFVEFMVSLIDHPEDVKELRSNGILLNCLGSDEKVVDIFNIISTDLVPKSETYLEIRTKIQKHYGKRCTTWIALGIYTYFRHPGTFIAFVAGFVALVLTFIQTWFAVQTACK